MDIQPSRPTTLAIAENIRKSDITAFYNDFRRSLLPALRDKLKDCRGHLDECAQTVISDESVRPFLKRVDTASREFRSATKKLADHASRARIFAQEIQYELERLSSSNHDDDDDGDDDSTTTAFNSITFPNGNLTLSRSDTDLSTSSTLTPSHSDTDLSTPSTSASTSTFTLIRRPALSSNPDDPTINVRHYLHELARTASRYYLESSHLPAAYTSLEHSLLTTRTALKQRHSELHTSLPSIQRHIPALERRETVHTLMDYFRQGVQSAIPYASNAIGQARELAHARGGMTAEHELTYARLDATLSDAGQALSASAPSTPSTPALQVKHTAHRAKVDVTNLASLVAMLDTVAADMRTVAGHVGIFARFWEETEQGVKRCIELSELVVTEEDWFAMLGGMVDQWGDLEGGLGQFARAVRI